MPDHLKLVPAAFADLPGWQQDSVEDIKPALLRSCNALSKKNPDESFGPAELNLHVQDYQTVCARLAAVEDRDFRAFLEQNFTVYQVTNNGDETGLFTGYYEAELKGSRTKSARYFYPVLKRPEDLVMVELGDFRDTLKGQRIAGRVIDGRLKPYENRAAIDAGALNSTTEVLAYVDDPVDAFFLHIQGSGVIEMDDGTEMRVGYDGQNGHPYIAIGQELIKRGALTKDNVSMQSIRAWLEAHPDERNDILHSNPSYVFFRESGQNGAVGSQNVVLTPERSMAIDRKFLPLGALLFLDAGDPDNNNQRLQRLMIAQDTGGAITGPVRGDVFWGHGDAATARAGMMKSKGRYWLLAPEKS